MPYVTEPSNEVIIHLQDFNGTPSTSQYWVAAAEVDPGSGAPLAIANGVQGISDSQVVSIELLRHAKNTTPGAPTTGPYDRVQDKAKLEFDCADGSTVILQIPGPLQTIFKPDHFDVDPSDALVTALVNALIAGGKNAQGAAIVGLSGGYRRVPPRLKNH